MNTKMKAGLAAALIGGTCLVAAPDQAAAQEIQVTGPLAGAPAVRKLRLYREGRFEVSPNVSFTLLDEYRRQIFLGLRANYGITDWLSAGVWGGISTSMVGLDINTDLTTDIQQVNEDRGCQRNSPRRECRLTAVNLGNDFTEQVASLNWIAAPQVTAVPFRGKLGLFNSVFVDADLYFFAGAAFVGVSERETCEDCLNDSAVDSDGSYQRADRMAVAPTFGLGFTFFTNRWTAVGAEYRAFPFDINAGGFDVAGEGRNNSFPDGQVDEQDRQFQFNQMLTINFNMYFPFEYKVSE